ARAAAPSPSVFARRGVTLTVGGPGFMVCAAFLQVNPTEVDLMLVRGVIPPQAGAILPAPDTQPDVVGTGRQRSVYHNLMQSVRWPVTGVKVLVQHHVVRLRVLFGTTVSRVCVVCPFVTSFWLSVQPHRPIGVQGVQRAEEQS